MFILQPVVLASDTAQDQALDIYEYMISINFA